MKNCFTIIFLMFSSCIYSQQNKMIYLWPGKVPGEPKEKNDPVIAPARNDKVLRYAEITNPAMEVFHASSSSVRRAGVVICPGGGYNMLAYDKEGIEIAEWLNKQGISAFVLQYRIPNKREGALQDIQRAIRIVRSNAEKWNIDPDQIGVIGFSAGGSLSARASTTFNKKTYEPVDKTDSLSCKPSFALLIYPAYLDQGPELTVTPEFQLTGGVPPMFIFQTADDSHANSALVMAGALRKQKIPVELHLLASGGHGYGLRSGVGAAETWPVLGEKWLLGVLKGEKKQ